MRGAYINYSICIMYSTKGGDRERWILICTGCMYTCRHSDRCSIVLFHTHFNTQMRCCSGVWLWEGTSATWEWMSSKEVLYSCYHNNQALSWFLCLGLCLVQSNCHMPMCQTIDWRFMRHLLKVLAAQSIVWHLSITKQRPKQRNHEKGLMIWVILLW